MILKGQYSNSELDKYTQDMINHLQRKTGENIPSPELTKKSFLDKLKSWPKRTTTSPLGIHLGHYRSLCTKLMIPKKAKGRQARFDSNRELLIDLHLALINYTIRFGYLFE